MMMMFDSILFHTIIIRDVLVMLLSFFLKVFRANV